MNKKFVRYNLEEVQEEVGLILRGLKADPDYTEERFYRAMQHIVHHVNIAWNARDIAEGAHEDATEEQLEQWGRYPTDFKLI